MEFKKNSELKLGWCNIYLILSQLNILQEWLIVVQFYDMQFYEMAFY